MKHFLRRRVLIRDLQFINAGTSRYGLYMGQELFDAVSIRLDGSIVVPFLGEQFRGLQAPWDDHRKIYTEAINRLPRLSGNFLGDEVGKKLRSMGHLIP
jgi:hypothetical protein